jgi:hypothetical protein
LSVVVTAFLLLALSARADDLLRITDLGTTGLTVAFSGRGAAMARDETGAWAGISIPGFGPLLPGSLGVDVPVRSWLIGIPPESHVTCEIIDATYYDISKSESDNIGAKLGEALADIPQKPADIEVTGYIRGRRVAGLRITPLVYERTSGCFRVFEAFKVRVAFGGASGREGASIGGVADPVAGDDAFLSRLLINYDQARFWQERHALSATQGDYFSSSPNWVKIAIDTTGFYCLTGADLEGAGIPSGSVASASVRLYTGGGLPLVESLTSQNPEWMRMAPIMVVDGADGKIDRGDSIVFYALGMNDWADLYDPDYGPQAHHRSFFSDRNYYWLTWGGTFSEPPKRMNRSAMVACDPCSDCFVPQSFRDRIHEERDWRFDFTIRADDGWYWRILSVNGTATFSVPMPHPDLAESVTVRLRIADSQSGECPGGYRRAILRLNQVAVKDTCWPAPATTRRVIDIYGKGLPVDSENQTIQIFLPNNLPDTLGTFRVCTEKPSLAWYQIFYKRRFIADSSELRFTSPDSTCTAKYVISGFDTGSLRAFDITDQFGVREITGFAESGGPEFTVTICDTVRKGETRHYEVISPANFMKPAAIVRTEIPDIRYASGRPYCVITHEDLVGAGEVIAGFHDGEMVTVQEIYDEFGWGVPDVTAIRDFLRWRYMRGDLEDVLLLGDATWDYKGRLTGETFTNYVPSYERRYRVGANSPYNTDDWFVYLEPADDGRPGSDSIAYFPTVPISRLPATSPEVADFLVENTIAYITDPEIGPWQNRIIMVADDDRTPDGCDEIQQGRHTEDMEAISKAAYPAVFDRVKIYLTEYPRESSGRKPAARHDLIDNLSMGALVTNFVGHGDPRRWADEEVFNNASVDLVNAGRRQSLLIASSCNVSKFDEPTFESCAELLLLRREGGTIGSLASTHLCQALPNRYLHEDFVRLLFSSDHLYPTLTIGEAAAGAKALTAALSLSWRFNDEMYTLMGDAKLRLAVPRLEVRFEEPAPDTLARKGLYNLSARVYEDGVPKDAFQGNGRLFVRESEDTSGYDSDICYIQPGNVPKHFAYSLPGAVIFRGKTSVAEGRLESGFFVNSGARKGPTGKIRCFVTDGTVAGVGLLDSLMIEGERTVDDVTGPELDLVTDGVELAGGDTVLVDQVIDILLSDPSGVAVKGKSELIPTVSVAIDESDRIELGDSVYAVAGDFRQSTVVFRVPQLAAGGHTFSVTAFDNLSNSTTRDYDLTVGQPGTGAANVVYAYPNPVSGDCYLIWEYENDLFVEVNATIYTLAGRKIWTGSAEGRSSQHMIVWDGRDSAGDMVANGTYLAVVEARAPSEAGFDTKDTIAIVVAR